MWDYKAANIENIKKAIINFNWEKAFENLSVNSKVELMNEILMNIFRNYIPNKKIKCDYSQPPWMNGNIKKSLKERSKLTKMFYKNGQKSTDKDKVLAKSAECTKNILEAKNNYILKRTKKLEDSNTAPKTYWAILNRLLYNKKIPAIPPLFIDGKFVSDFYKKANIFNNFFCIYMHTYKKCKHIASFLISNRTKNKFFPCL